MKCPNCNGRKFIPTGKKNPKGMGVNIGMKLEPCPVCHGSGEVPDAPAALLLTEEIKKIALKYGELIMYAEYPDRLDEFAEEVSSHCQLLIEQAAKEAERKNIAKYLEDNAILTDTTITADFEEFWQLLASLKSGERLGE